MYIDMLRGQEKKRQGKTAYFTYSIIRQLKFEDHASRKFGVEEKSEY